MENRGVYVWMVILTPKNLIMNAKNVGLNAKLVLKMLIIAIHAMKIKEDMVQLMEHALAK